VQSQAFDLILSGVDVVARSKTGTGKTLAFGLPLIERLVGKRKGDNTHTVTPTQCIYLIKSKLLTQYLHTVLILIRT